MTSIPPKDSPLINLFQKRDGSMTTVELRDGRRLEVSNVAWGYDEGDPFAHVTTNCSPFVAGKSIDVFSTDNVVVVHDESGRELYRQDGVVTDPPRRACFVEQLDDILRLDLPDGHFTVLLAADARGSSDELVLEIMAHLLTKGMVELSSWGPDCERIHDLADRVIIDTELETDDGEITIMTSWFPNQPIEEAAYFAACCALPSDVFLSTFVERLAIVVGNRDWVEPTERVLHHPAEYAEDWYASTMRGRVQRVFKRLINIVR